MMSGVDVKDFDESGGVSAAIDKLLERSDAECVYLLREGQIVGALWRPDNGLTLKSRLVQYLTDNPEALSKILAALSEQPEFADLRQ